MRSHILLMAALLVGINASAMPEAQYTAEALQRSWGEVYASDPLFESLLEGVLEPELLVMGSQDLPAPNKRQGFQAVAAQSGSTLSFFPVKNLSREDAERLYGNLYKIEGLAEKYRHYIGQVEDRKAPDDFPATLLQRQHALNLERFTAYTVLFLTAEKLPQKCAHYIRAKTHAAEILAYAATDLPNGWSSYGSQAARFIQDAQRGFARIPAQLCQFQTQISRAANEATVRKQVNATLTKAMGDAIEKHENVIKERTDVLQSVVSKSQLAIPMDKLAALDRGFRDTNSLLEMIKGDLLLLYTDGPKDPSLLKQVADKIKSLSEGTDLLVIAQNALNGYEKALKPFLGSLEEIPNLTYPNAAQKAKVQSCAGVSQILGATQDAGQQAQNQKKFETCLLATAALYKEARETFVDDPALVEFTSKLAMLMSYFPEIPKPATPRT